jgi:hypothetical protein
MKMWPVQKLPGKSFTFSKWEFHVELGSFPTFVLRSYGSVEGFGQLLDYP